MKSFVWCNSYPVIIFNLLCSTALVILYAFSGPIVGVWAAVKFVLFALLAFGDFTATIDGKEYRANAGSPLGRPVLNLILLPFALV